MVFRDLAAITDLFRQWGDHMYDEEVSQTTHAVQCARRAQREGASIELTLAALLHDVGHLLEIKARASAEVVADVDHRHQESGALALSGIFGESVTEPIRWHVEAKRYLCATDGDYASSLSAGSTVSLALQGGPMSEPECAEFLDNPRSADAIRLRRWDDRGKDVDDPPASFDDFEQLLTVLVDGLTSTR
jgi:phosphonate degradation associated HDIG domain protein